MNNRLGRGFSDDELAAHFKADYVIRLDIHNMSLYERGRTLFTGRAEMEVAATHFKGAEENELLKEFYRITYPGPSGMPIEVGGNSPLQFRSLFLNRIARDLSRWFAAFPKEERLDMD